MGLVAILVGALGLWWYRFRIPAAPQTALWIVLLASFLAASRDGWRRLFGPLLFYDVLRTARRGRYIALRCVYAGLLLGLLFTVYYSWFGGRNTSMRELFSGASVESRAMTRFAGSFFSTFMGAQFAAVVLLTPAYAAGSIAEEKERRTLEFLLATDLHSREIILGKLASRLGNMTLLILTGLPFLGLLQFLGGVDPNLVLAGFVATFFTMLSVGAASVMASVWSNKALDAMALTYLWVIGYLVLSGFVAACIPGLTAGNPIVAFKELTEAWSRSHTQSHDLALLLLDYGLFHWWFSKGS